MSFPANLKYTKEHEWVSVQGNIATIGITDHAQSALGDVVFVELPAVGRVLKSHETFGVVESIKAVSDLYAPLAGKVVEVNSALPNEPSQVNSSPYESAWMIKVEIADPASVGALMDAGAYEKYVASLK